MLKNKKGFTLIELLVVIAIITILAAALIIGINPARHFKNARNATRLSQMNSIASAIYSYAVENNGTFPVPVTPGYECIGPVDDPVAIGIDPDLWCYDDDVPGSLIVPKYLHALPKPPLALENYLIEFVDIDQEAIKITSSADEANEPGKEIIIIQ